MKAEVNILPNDIGKFNIGYDARVKFTAFPFQKYGTLNGKLRTISENTFEINSAGGKNALYHARLSLSNKLQNVPKKFRLIPGMEIIAEIKVGKRRIIEYITVPLIKALEEAINEP